MSPEAVLSGRGQPLEQSVLKVSVKSPRVMIVTERNEIGDIEFFLHQGSDGQVLRIYSRMCFDSLNLLRRASRR